MLACALGLKHYTCKLYVENGSKDGGPCQAADDVYIIKPAFTLQMGTQIANFIECKNASQT